MVVPMNIPVKAYKRSQLPEHNPRTADVAVSRPQRNDHVVTKPRQHVIGLCAPLTRASASLLPRSAVTGSDRRHYTHCDTALQAASRRRPATTSGLSCPAAAAHTSALGMTTTLTGFSKGIETVFEQSPGDVLCRRLAAGPAAAAAAIASSDGSALAPLPGDSPSVFASSAAMRATLAATPALAARTGRECATASAPRRGESRGSWPLVADTGTVTGSGSGRLKALPLAAASPSAVLESRSSQSALRRSADEEPERAVTKTRCSCCCCCSCCWCACAPFPLCESKVSTRLRLRRGLACPGGGLRRDGGRRGISCKPYAVSALRDGHPFCCAAYTA